MKALLEKTDIKLENNYINALENFHRCRNFGDVHCDYREKGILEFCRDCEYFEVDDFELLNL